MTMSDGHYQALERGALTFYLEHGWVVIDDVLPRQQLEKMRSAWLRLCDRCVSEIGCSAKQYNTVVSQWRDLWKRHPPFAAALKNPLSGLAWRSLQTGGVRLLHDHIIRKNAQGSNGLIPWHQDSMFWPVDRTGLSTWTAFDRVDADCGCIEVISGSHRWPPSPPVDFMDTTRTAADDADPQSIPVAAGATVILHSRTWHRSRPTLREAERSAYIALWVPTGSRFRPENAAWHPLNEQITVNPGEVLNDDQFPLFGDAQTSLGNSGDNRFAQPPVRQGMFNAGRRTTQQVAALLDDDQNLRQMLGTAVQRQQLTDRLATLGVDRSVAQPVIEQLWVAASAFELHRSRDVFNHAYVDWEALLSNHDIDVKP